MWHFPAMPSSTSFIGCCLSFSLTLLFSILPVKASSDEGGPGYLKGPMPLDELTVFSKALDTIEKEYIEQRNRLDLSRSCLKGMGEAIPKQEELTAYYRSIAAGFSRRMDPATSRSTEALEDCLHGMVDTLNRYSVIYGEEASKALIKPDRTIGGIGLELERGDKGARVISTHRNGPAVLAGIKTGDVLVRIDGQETVRVSLDKIVDLLRGKPGSQLSVDVFSPTQTAIRTIVLERRVVQREPARVELKEHGVAYIAIDDLSTESLNDVTYGIQMVLGKTRGEIQGIVLDLRQNSGGLLNISVAIGAIFLPDEALVLETIGRSEIASMRLFARKSDYIRAGQKDPLLDLPEEVRTAPMVVLVGPKTAAGAEALAAALKDHQRATLVGERTFGKGYVETVMPLSGTRSRRILKLTTASIIRPNGEPLENSGVQPDIVARQHDASTHPDMVLEEGLRILLSKLP